MLGLLLKTERSIQLYTLPMVCNQWSFELLLPFWSVTPSIRQFLHTLWLDIFSLWDHSANPRVGCGWSSELPRSPFFLILMLTFNFSSSSLLHPHSWTWLSCCHVVGWLFVWTFKLNFLPNEVAGEFVTTALAMKHVRVTEAQIHNPFDIRRHKNYRFVFSTQPTYWGLNVLLQSGKDLLSLKNTCSSQYNFYSTKTCLFLPVCYDSPRRFNVRHEVSNNLDNGGTVFQD